MLKRGIGQQTIQAALTARAEDALPAIIDLATDLGAGRLEVAHVQYHGWAIANRASLMPSREDFLEAAAQVEPVWRAR